MVKKNTARITDFGTSRPLKNNSSQTIVKGTPVYCPPEYLNILIDADDEQKIRTSKKHDMFSLGIIAHQIFADGQHPFEFNEETTKYISIGKYSINYNFIKKGSSIDLIIKGKTFYIF